MTFFSENNKAVQSKKSMSQLQMIGIGFICIIIIGAFILMLPVSSRDHSITSFFDCLFTATSATCVTGLVVVDTYQHWSVFGQIIIITMIQIGGLGFVTIGVYLSVILRNKIGLRQRTLLQESINAQHVGGIVRLAKNIIKGTAIVEGTGAILLSFYFIPRTDSIAKGIYYSVFHAVSAFCNAGFDLLGKDEAFASFTGENADPYVLTVLMMLILIGGIGFLVWQDVCRYKFKFKKYSLHTKIVLSASFVLVFGGGILFFILENDNTLLGMSPIEKAANALFASVTPRTAGFNSIDVEAMTPAAKMLTLIFMFIGGCPGSTAGGAKVSTIMVMLLLLKSSVLSQNGCNIFGRRIPENAVIKAMVVITFNSILITVGVIIIAAIERLQLTDIAFEVFSAMGTVGMTTGITRSLGTVSRVVIICLMYFGRIGSLSFAMAVFDRKKPSAIRLPEEKVLIG